MLTRFGVGPLASMMITCGLERRHAGFVLAFACGCAGASAYGFLSGASGSTASRAAGRGADR